MFAASGFFRRVKKPTPTGTRMKIKDRQSRTYPIVGDKAPELPIPLKSVEYGMFPVAVTAPKIQENKAQQPQSTAVTMVMIMAVFRFCI